jgi:hypothetical protein
VTAPRHTELLHDTLTYAATTAHIDEERRLHASADDAIPDPPGLVDLRAWGDTNERGPDAHDRLDRCSPKLIEQNSLAEASTSLDSPRGVLRAAESCN